MFGSLTVGLWVSLALVVALSGRLEGLISWRREQSVDFGKAFRKERLMYLKTQFLQEFCGNDNEAGEALRFLSSKHSYLMYESSLSKFKSGAAAVIKRRVLEEECVRIPRARAVLVLSQMKEAEEVSPARDLQQYRARIQKILSAPNPVLADLDGIEDLGNPVQN